ncbi:MAG: hypothetical protein HYX26_00965 [Acidobacteriales bacterium]|nr:hypothetical protein [Terriglobales bacterium]
MNQTVLKWVGILWLLSLAFSVLLAEYLSLNSSQKGWIEFATGSISLIFGIFLLATVNNAPVSLQREQRMSGVFVLICGVFFSFLAMFRLVLIPHIWSGI